MSTPKKPGTDLAALKARLAKKTADASPSASPDTSDPGDFAARLPVAEPPPPPAADPIPSYAPPAAPAASFDAPIVAPTFEAAPFSAPAASSAAPAADDPFGGEGGFDPSAGLLESGEIKSRGSAGLAAFFGIIAFAFGGAVGYLGHGILGKGGKVEEARAKGAKVAASAKAISESRKSVSLVIEDLVKKAQTDPAGAAADIEALLKDKFDTQERIEGLFGWQLASLSPDGVRSTFKLFEEASRLKTDLGYLGAFLSANAEALKDGGSAPVAFAVAFKGGVARLVAAQEPLCGDLEKPAELTTCSPNDAVAFRVQTAIGAEPTVLPKGTEDGQGVLLSAEGSVFGVAVGLEPRRNAVATRDGLLLRINEHLEAMAKAEKVALEKLDRYVDSPNIDGPQS